MSTQHFAPSGAEATPAVPRRIAIVYRELATLKLDPHNPRVHSKKQIEQIARSIRAFGFNVPILINAQNKILAGHGRILACRQLGWSEVPTIMLEHLTPEQAQAFLIADNKLTENASWDEQLLAQQLQALCAAQLDFSIEATGFEIAEIDLLIDNLTPAAEGENDPRRCTAQRGPGSYTTRRCMASRAASHLMCECVGAKLLYCTPGCAQGAGGYCRSALQREGERARVRQGRHSASRICHGLRRDGQRFVQRLSHPGLCAACPA
jgi:hypothetical protein